jgi:pimeloyl-ACP methyl ester carboxylesterase
MNQPETVVIVHGLWVHGVVMTVLARRIASGGFRVANYSYPSVRLTLSENSERLARFCLLLGSGTLHFVGHSLGAILVARLLMDTPRFATGRAVLLAPPFNDTYAGRRLASVAAGRAAIGRSVGEWLAGERSCSLAQHDVGVIAGRVGVGLGRVIAPGLPAPNDGTITVEETRAPGIRDHLILPVSHSAMVFSREVAREVCAFLRDGKFSRGGGQFSRGGGHAEQREAH